MCAKHALARLSMTLPCRVPDRERNYAGRVGQRDRVRAERAADRRAHLASEGPFLEPVNERRLPDAAVAEQDDFGASRCGWKSLLRFFTFRLRLLVLLDSVA